MLSVSLYVPGMPHPTITLLTDYGTRDGYVASLKGVILSLAPTVRIVDAAHDIPAHDVAAGAWALGQYWRYFSPETLHVAVVDPGVGTDRALLLAEADHHLFLAPDNGLLTWVMRQAKKMTVSQLKPEVRRPDLSATFHGRDILAHAAGLLASGQAKPSDLAVPCRELVLPNWAVVERTEQELKGRIVYVDRFGNLVTNISRHQVREMVGLSFSVSAGRYENIPVCRTYAEIPAGELAALFGSSDTLELAVPNASAAELTGLARGEAVSLRPARG